MKIIYIAILLVISISFAHAESDLDIWNKALKSQSSEEACTKADAPCAKIKTETSLPDSSSSVKESSLEKKGSAVKTQSKTKKNPVMLNVEKIDIETATEPLEKQVIPSLKITLSVILGAIFGFMFIYFIRKRRRNNG
ncbi:MAG: hypothetical protein KKD35_02285 [Elusimicrobia bacterium]|nr:hypothetical protein [Elusimicrobiota bacterium]